MFKMPETIEYALPEQIGEPDLFVGRKTEFSYFLGDWYRLVEKNFAQNQAIISRRKKGKTAFYSVCLIFFGVRGWKKKRVRLMLFRFITPYVMQR